jgi:hypothetical protein
MFHGCNLVVTHVSDSPRKINKKRTPEKNGGKPRKREQIPEMCP